MTEIDKLYSLAGIEPQKQCYYWDCPYSTGDIALDLQKEKDCTNCNNPDKAAYPPFTAEKQLELIKWLSELDMLEIMRTTREDKAWIIKSEYEMSGNIYKHASRLKSFEESLAGLINSLWEDLTEAEHNEIRNILRKELS